MSLATFSDELKIFSGESYNLSASLRLNKTPGTFGRITWSGDAKWITVTPTKDINDPLHVYKYKDNSLIPVKYVTLTSVTSASFFNWTNRNIAVGTESGDIYIWDLKQKKIAVNVDVAERHSVDHISVNSDDVCIASGSLNDNKICIHSLKTNKVVNTYSLPKSEHLSSLSFCMCKKSFLAASSYESTICIWDVVKSDIVCKISNSHSGACTGISFSPINYSLLASVGLTKKLKLYDLRDKACIFDANINEPMHSVDMISNGDKVIVGTNGGEVIIYDLRASKVSTQIKAHEGPVLSVKMQITKVPKAYQEVEMNTPDVIEVENKTLDLSVMDVFSPIYRISKNSSVFSAKAVSFHSTPIVMGQENESVIAYNDSFLSKMISPKREGILLSTPLQAMTMNKTEILSSSIKLGTVQEEPVDSAESACAESDVNEETQPGDGIHNQGVSLDPSTQNIILEIKEIHKELKHISRKLTSLEKEVQTMKLDNEGKYQLLQENHENLFEYLINGIKQEIFCGNCDSKLEHIIQRLLIENITTLMCEKNDKLISEMEKCVQKINSVHKVLNCIQK